MKLENYKTLLYLICLSGIAYLIHKLIFNLLEINDVSFYYTIETLYLIFSGLSSLIFILLLKIKQKNFDNVGMSFLLATSVKMIVCYLILKPILHATRLNNSIEKMNFFVIFILFLAIETVLTIRILNEKQ